MIYIGQKYRITKPINKCHIAKVGDIIEISKIGRYGAHSMDISIDDNGNPYNGILMFEGPYTLQEYWEKVEMCLEAV
ncbi:hypothetical protein PHG31p92 [Aeromonas phage 31]|uniref:Uncharacterized protein n=3 Tax=Biquartavirus 44RR2 TaxID=115987 RepID=Q6U9K8_9CAUD|nr:hypothetical protein ST44RRORF094c [Aeromonas phage 44RR2.8t]YP_238821.1 hypothetical protein PHG31p92 [Aeromonas phage 31]APU00565.1 hypothetical protein [Aeromonas phage 44RR2.8t.2]APU00985.1 hypothetical protein [Aeromonas phage 31.2]APU01897.1 hypothetical protein [Aeromonas phage L9-6]APU02147.1 hypothetical protein [Aeromonas phage Riv-10]APU02394.1 hypothetical protein [Aeromonas phage SW69-9]